MIVDEFTNKLIDNDIFDNINDGTMTCNEIFDLIEESNQKFYKEISYLENVNRNDTHLLFSQEEIIIIKEHKNCLFLKNNNFIEYFILSLCDINDKKPMHEYKNIRQSVSKETKKTVWKKEYNSKKIGTCPIFKCNNQVEKEHFHCGHIISVCNGGTNSLENLRPICADCNSKMSSDNWDAYERNLILNFYKNKCCYCKKKQDCEKIIICDNRLYCKKCHENNNNSDSDNNDD
jgi:hypothetical protein